MIQNCVRQRMSVLFFLFSMLKINCIQDQQSTFESSFLYTEHWFQVDTVLEQCTAIKWEVNAWFWTFLLAIPLE